MLPPLMPLCCTGLNEGRGPTVLSVVSVFEVSESLRAPGSLLLPEMLPGEATTALLLAPLLCGCDAAFDLRRSSTLWLDATRLLCCTRFTPEGGEGADDLAAPASDTLRAECTTNLGAMTPAAEEEERRRPEPGPALLLPLLLLEKMLGCLLVLGVTLPALWEPLARAGPAAVGEMELEAFVTLLREAARVRLAGGFSAVLFLRVPGALEGMGREGD